MKDSLKAGGGPCVTVPTASSVKLAVTGGSWPTYGNPFDVLRVLRDRIECSSFRTGVLGSESVSMVDVDR